MRRSLIPVCFALASLALNACGKPPESAPAPTSPEAATTAARPMALALAPPTSNAPLAVSSLAIGAGQRIADRNTAYHEGLSPPLAWGSVAGVRTWAVIVEDPDAPSPQPYLHWLAWNLPAETVGLPEGLTSATAPTGMVQGLNDDGEPGWTGPRPPAGTGDHHYHFEVFALDTVLELPISASREDVIAAMGGHVLASGEAVGLAAAP
jgi:Raf kinase inhibitor-like YbhB/YbcL family protein